ncbi:MAG: hypothetical protein JWP12_1451 [Bacteroidetes bacterium]|nr:hypothetical protein [Bacteroidota bacterium]
MLWLNQKNNLTLCCHPGPDPGSVNLKDNADLRKCKMDFLINYFQNK